MKTARDEFEKEQEEAAPAEGEGDEGPTPTRVFYSPQSITSSRFIDLDENS